MKPSIEREMILWEALRKITAYDPPERIKRTAVSRYGLDPAEAIEMAYENVLTEAKNAIRGMRRPT